MKLHTEQPEEMCADHPMCSHDRPVARNVAVILGLLTLSIGIVFAGRPHLAHATGFTDIGQDIPPNPGELELSLDGYFRIRGDLLFNLDLDRGPTPSGQLFFPVSLADPTEQMLTYFDMRMRTDISAYAPGGNFALKVRFDVLDNVALGSLPDAMPTLTTSQLSPDNVLLIRRIYAEMLLPFGYLAAGRMGNHWGLGMLANGGDCADCDSGDSADRIAFVTPLIGHVWAVAYDFSATGPLTQRRAHLREVDFEPSDDLHTFTFAVMSFRNEESRLRRRRAGKATVEYGAYVSHRWQSNDVPADYLPTAQPVELSSAQVMARGFTATALDGWFRLTLPFMRVELELAVMFASIEQPSLIPGVHLNEGASSTQFGVALESEFLEPEGAVVFGLDAGFASGDAAYGFGAFPDTFSPQPQAGDLDGPQANPPYDNTVDNFRFHPDYHVDQILFREIIGTVTDAFYFRPHVRWRVAEIGKATLTLSLTGIVSFAVNETSSPGGKQPLGVELDPTFVWDSGDGFSIALEYAVLFPLEGLDNPFEQMPAKPAQLARVRFIYGF